MSIKDLPEKLRPYAFHGLSLQSPRNNEASGTCPFCDGHKFSVNAITGKWRCWSCAEGSKKGGGNIFTFITHFHGLCYKATTAEDYEDLREHIGLLDTQFLIEWQIARSLTTDDWLVPGYNAQGGLTSLYRYIAQDQGGYRLIPTPTLGHRLNGMALWNPDKPILYLCEGWKDGLILTETLAKGKNCEERGLCPTANRDASLFSQANVLAVPGAEVFFDTWLPLFEGKVVNLMYDSDHPRKHSKTGHITDGAGWRAMKKVVEILSSSPHQPLEINILHWGEDGYDQTKKSGYDVRDYILTG